MSKRFLLLGLGLTAFAVLMTTLPGYNPLVRDASLLIGGSDATDAVGHVVLFGLLTAVWYSALRRSTADHRALLFAAALVLTIGALTEFYQRLVPDRGSNFIDLGANALGVATCVAWVRIRKMRAA
jgi:hypothetical protein